MHAACCVLRAACCMATPRYAPMKNSGNITSTDHHTRARCLVAGSPYPPLASNFCLQAGCRGPRVRRSAGRTRLTRSARRFIFYTQRGTVTGRRRCKAAWCLLLHQTRRTIAAESSSHCEVQNHWTRPVLDVWTSDGSGTTTCRATCSPRTCVVLLRRQRDSLPVSSRALVAGYLQGDSLAGHLQGTALDD